MPTLVNVDSGGARYWPPASPAFSGVATSLPWLFELDAAAQIGDSQEQKVLCRRRGSQQLSQPVDLL